MFVTLEVVFKRKKTIKVEDTQGWLLYRGLYHYVGLTANYAYRNSKTKYIRQLTAKHKKACEPVLCWLCGEKIKHKEINIDHVVPVNLIYKYELYGLLTDPRNFQPAHFRCNVGRGALTIDDLPATIRNKIVSVSTVD